MQTVSIIGRDNSMTTLFESLEIGRSLMEQAGGVSNPLLRDCYLPSVTDLRKVWNGLFVWSIDELEK